jgi:hypothetical protein
VFVVQEESIKECKTGEKELKGDREKRRREKGEEEQEKREE